MANVPPIIFSFWTQISRWNLLQHTEPVTQWQTACGIRTVKWTHSALMDDVYTQHFPLTRLMIQLQICPFRRDVNTLTRGWKCVLDKHTWLNVTENKAATMNTAARNKGSSLHHSRFNRHVCFCAESFKTDPFISHRLEREVYDCERMNKDNMLL